MKQDTVDTTNRQTPDLAELRSCLAEFPENRQPLDTVVQQLHAFVEMNGWAQPKQQCAQTMAKLVELCNLMRNDDDQNELCSSVIAAVTDRLEILENVDEIQALQDAREFVDQMQTQWGEYLECVAVDSQFPNIDMDWENPPSTDSSVGEDQNEPVHADNAVPGQQIEMMLAAIGTANELEPENTETESSDDSDQLFDNIEALHNDDELREAFLDDAERCLDSMEQCSLAAERQDGDSELLNQFCRELHTLKGASASVGLAKLANYVHDVETDLLSIADLVVDDSTVEVMLKAVDRVRSVVAEISVEADVDANSDQEHPQPVDLEVQPIQAVQQSVQTVRQTTPVIRTSQPAACDSLIRIRSSKLDRLMDMLAELVVLRNRRESHHAEVCQLNAELSRCVSRLNYCQEGMDLMVGSSAHSNACLTSGSNTLREIGKDISELSREIGELQQPIGDDNLAISRFIRDFRQELMQLRRVPLSGLFNRLERAARDAARNESKQINFTCTGDECGLEQELQEKLYEPLLHIVRNAVSHGIESAPRRSGAGKDECGTIFVHAQSNSQVLAIEVGDDGDGMDFDAIRRRGLEKGLLSVDQVLSDRELANLIFHPGFSTCESATQVSGRGVGMDVVARAINQIRGKIEINSVPGKGTTMRLLIPLNAAIEHVMVFRCAGQNFAVPMQAVSSAANKLPKTEIDCTPFTSVMSVPPKTDPREVLVLRTAENRLGGSNAPTGKPKRPVGIVVDQIMGHEEVVVRNLPGPLANHPLFAGLTLSGLGETVLLLDSRKLMEFLNQHQAAEAESVQATAEDSDATGERRVLVVDDSMSARKLLAKKLKGLGWKTVEAGDGIEALEQLRKGSFSLVMTDLDMPRLGGLELLMDIQQRHAGEMPVVVVSSRKEDEFGDQIMSRGAVAYLQKPVDDAKLNGVLETLINNVTND